MPYKFPLKVELDVPEPRIEAGRLVVAADGSSWDEELYDGNTFICPQTGTLMLRPLPFTTAWGNTYTGKYSRFRKADYLFPEYVGQANDWVELQMRAVGDYWLMGSGLNFPIYLNQRFNANTPMHVQVFVPGFATSDTLVALEFGFNRNQSNELTIRLNGNGTLDLIKGGVRVNQFDRKDNTYETRYGEKKTETYKSNYLSFTIIPYRRRELLIMTDKGQSFLHTFDDLDADSTSNTILPEGVFYVYAPAGRPIIQTAQVYFASSGVAYGNPVELRYAPSLSEFSPYDFRIYGDLIGYPSGSLADMSMDLVRADTLATWVPDAQIRSVRPKITLTASGDQTQTNGVYLVEAYNTPTTTTTYDDTTEITTAIEALRLSVDENGRTTVAFTARKKELETLGVDRPAVTGNRTFRVALENDTGDIDLVRGTLNAPAITYLTGDATVNKDNAILSFQGQDRMGTLDNALVTGPAYDGFAPVDAIGDLLEQGGFGGEPYLVSSFGSNYIFPYNPKISMGEYNLLPERGDTVGKWLDKLRTDFAATWQMGWVPTVSGYTFMLADPNTQSTAPVAVLYLESADARSAWTGNEPAVASRIVRNLSEHYESPEANQVIVVGQDPMTRLLIYGNYNDALSQDPTLLPSARPLNWLGEVRTVYYSDPSLTNQESVGRAGLILAQRLMPGRRLVQFDSDILVAFANGRPLWIGDVVRIIDTDNTTIRGDYRIVAVPSVEFIREDTTNEIYFRRATYTGWLINNQSLDFSDYNNSGLWFV